MIMRHLRCGHTCLQCHESPQCRIKVGWTTVKGERDPGLGRFSWCFLLFIIIFYVSRQSTVRGCRSLSFCGLSWDYIDAALFWNTYSIKETFLLIQSNWRIRMICSATLSTEIICFSHFEWNFPKTESASYDLKRNRFVEEKVDKCERTQLCNKTGRNKNPRMTVLSWRVWTALLFGSGTRNIQQRSRFLHSEIMKKQVLTKWRTLFYSRWSWYFWTVSGT